MYWPYLRGKQNEQFAVLELAGTLSPLVVPIFKPTSVSRDAANRYVRMADQGVRFALITNSDNGDPVPSYDEVMVLLQGRLEQYGSVLPAFELRPDCSLGQLRRFTEQNRDRLCLVVHRGHVYGADEIIANMRLVQDPIHAYVLPGTSASLRSGLPASGKIVISDGFEYYARNGDYPRLTNFDDLVTRYSQEGFDGFGDFSVIGDRFSSGGRRANHVTLHLTEMRGSGLVTNHFVSTSAPNVGDNASKYFEALRLLVGYVGNPPQPGLSTAGAGDYVQALQNGFPGLGVPKKWSIKHHTELVERALLATGAVPFV